MPAKILTAKSYKLKIAIVCYPTVGGSGILATNLGNELARRGHRVHFISYAKPVRLLTHKNIFFHKVYINKYELFKYPDYTLPLAVTMGAIHKKYKLDVLHVHSAVPHATAALLFEKMMHHSGIKPPHIVTTLHGTDITLLARNRHLFEIIKYSIERSCCVTAVSNYLNKETHKVLKTKKLIHTIYNFFTPKKITKSRQIIRRSLKLSNRDFVAIHLSNLRPVKRIPDLLKIAAKLKTIPNFKLLILSGGDFSPYNSLVKKLKLGRRLMVKDGILDIENYINASDIGVYTSSEESFGLSALETMSLQKPVVASRAGGLPEVILNGKTGFLCKVGDIADFASAIKKLMENEPFRIKMGKAAKLRAETEFSTKKIVDQYISYYSKHF